MAASPSPFVADWIPRIARRTGSHRRALDFAMGSGRHTLALHKAGYRVFGADLSLERVIEAQAAARTRGWPLIAWVADLTTFPLPHAAFDLVLCTNYLARGHWDQIQTAIRPGGVVLYETFTIAQLARAGGPRSPSHLLRPDELRDAFEGWRVLFYEETTEPDALARLVAERP